MAIVVDVSATGGGILKVHKDSLGQWGNEAIGNVGSGDGEAVTDRLVIVPWLPEWWYRCVGDVVVRYIVRT